MSARWSGGQNGQVLRTTWPQVLAWRMRRQLLDPLGELDAVDTVRRLCGVQAQVPAAAALAVRVRRRSAPSGGVTEALQERRLMRTWAMRGTLHLLPPDQAGAYLSLVAASRPWEKASWQKTFGVAPDEMAALVEAVGQVLDGRVLSRDELVAELGHLLRRPELEAELRSGWGAVLKPVAWQGRLCHATSDGNRVSFARPDQWLPDWTGVPDSEEAAGVVIPAYLRACGPATPERFDAWLTRGTSRKAAVRSWFAALDDRLATVEVDGRPALLLAEDVDELRRDLADGDGSPSPRLRPVRARAGHQGGGDHQRIRPSGGEPGGGLDLPRGGRRRQGRRNLGGGRRDGARAAVRRSGSGPRLRLGG
jgi:hypothetical protein